jgi:hypothetical protein
MSLQIINSHTNPQDLHYFRLSLAISLRGLREQCRNNYVARTLYCIPRNQIWPDEAQLLAGLEDPELAADNRASLSGEIQSAWVPCIVNNTDDPVAEELSKLANQFLTLDLGGQSDDGTGYDSSLPA